MYKYIFLALAVLVIISCNKNSSSPTSSYNNNNNNNSSTFFVDWTVESQHYRTEGDAGTVGLCAHRAMGVNVRANKTSQYPFLVVIIDSVQGNGTYTLSPQTNSQYSIIWYNTSAMGDTYTYLTTAAEANGTITVTDFSSTYVAGSFSGRLAAVLGVNSYKYVNVSGTFKIPRIE